MVFLALTPEGLRRAVELSKASPFPIWCGADVISEEEFKALHLQAIDLSRFIYALAGEPTAVLQRALETIAEHHPNATIWIEHVPAR